MVSALDYPAADGRPVTQGHADYCKAHGHASHVIDGRDTGRCPRCGEAYPIPRPTGDGGTVVTCTCGVSFRLDSVEELDHYVWAVRPDGTTSNLGNCPVSNGMSAAVDRARHAFGLNRAAYRGAFV